MLTLIVHIKARKGKEQALESELRRSVPPTHEEEGCVRFALHRSPKNPGNFLLVERWKSQGALDEHMKKPYLKDLLARLKDLAEHTEAQPYELLEEGDGAKLL